MKSQIIYYLTLIILFKFTFSIYCLEIGNNLASVTTCKNGTLEFSESNKSCCFQEIFYKNSNYKSQSCIIVIKDIKEIQKKIDYFKSTDESIKDVSINCSSSFLKFIFVLTFILLLF
jgi:hypothetical protein